MGNAKNISTFSEKIDKKDFAPIEGICSPVSHVTTATTTGEWIQASDGRWWYRHSDGTYTTSGWELINDKWYYFDEEGWMKTGWIDYNSKRYYCGSDGAMVVSWQQIGSEWYFFNANGEMLTGWQTIGEYTYYFRPSGTQAYGWLKDSGNWYFLLANTGRRASGTVTIVGKSYTFGTDGKLQTSYIDTSLNTTKMYTIPVVANSNCKYVQSFTIVGKAMFVLQVDDTNTKSILSYYRDFKNETKPKFQVPVNDLGHANGMTYYNGALYVATVGNTIVKLSTTGSKMATYKMPEIKYIESPTVNVGAKGINYVGGNMYVSFCHSLSQIWI